MQLTPPTLPTLPCTYNDYTYWIEGTPPAVPDRSGEYRYVIRKGRNDVSSEETFARVLDANAAAREAIDLLTGTVQRPKPKPAQDPIEAEPKESTKRRRKTR